MSNTYDKYLKFISNKPELKAKLAIDALTGWIQFNFVLLEQLGRITPVYEVSQ